MLVSRHFLRRRARARAQALIAAEPVARYTYKVEKASRGPFRWRVIRHTRRV